MVTFERTSGPFPRPCIPLSVCVVPKCLRGSHPSVALTPLHGFLTWASFVAALSSPFCKTGFVHSDQDLQFWVCRVSLVSPSVTVSVFINSESCPLLCSSFVNHVPSSAACLWRNKKGWVVLILAFLYSSSRLNSPSSPRCPFHS